MRPIPQNHKRSSSFDKTFLDNDKKSLSLSISSRTNNSNEIDCANVKNILINTTYTKLFLYKFIFS